MGEFSLQDAMQHYLNNSKFKNGMQAVRIEAAWENIMGKTVARYTEKIQIAGNTLFITTNVAPLRNELLFQKQAIIDRVNEALGDKVISELVIR